MDWEHPDSGPVRHELLSLGKRKEWLVQMAKYAGSELVNTRNPIQAIKSVRREITKGKIVRDALIEVLGHAGVSLFISEYNPGTNRIEFAITVNRHTTGSSSASFHQTGESFLFTDNGVYVNDATEPSRDNRMRTFSKLRDVIVRHNPALGNKLVVHER